MAGVRVLVLLGFVGAALVIVAFFANQQGWLPSDDWRFPLLNLVGAALIMASLYVEWNFPSAIIEGFWIVISAYGLLRSARR